MAKLTNEKWTLVQHSAFGYAEKPGWEKAVEAATVAMKEDLAGMKV